MGYFAFVRRDADRRYHATLPDFPGCAVDAARIDALDALIADAVRGVALQSGWPAPTRLEALPRQTDAHDGFWLMIEIDDAPQA